MVDRIGHALFVSPLVGVGGCVKVAGCGYRQSDILIHLLGERLNRLGHFFLRSCGQTSKNTTLLKSDLFNFIIPSMFDISSPTR